MHFSFQKRIFERESDNRGQKLRKKFDVVNMQMMMLIWGMKRQKS